MIFKKAKHEPYSNENKYIGRTNGYKIEVIDNTYYSGKNGWYFMIHDTKSDYIFNSLWKFKGFESYEICTGKAEEYVNQIVR